MRRCGGLRIRRLLLAGCFSFGILGCDSTSGVSVPASVFGCIQGFNSSLATAFHVLLAPFDAQNILLVKNINLN